jgi:hypothetical protein
MNYTQITMGLQLQWQLSERFARNPLLLAQPQTFMLHQILRHVSSSEISIDNKFRFGYQDGYDGCLIGVLYGEILIVGSRAVYPILIHLFWVPGFRCRCSGYAIVFTLY